MDHRRHAILVRRQGGVVVHPSAVVVTNLALVGADELEGADAGRPISTTPANSKEMAQTVVTAAGAGPPPPPLSSPTAVSDDTVALQLI